MPRTPAEWAAAAELGNGALELAAPAAGVRSFAEALSRAGHRVDAIRLLAHLLPEREAVLWAWVCAKKAAPPAAPPALSASLAATEKWIAQPADDNRRAAMAAAQEAGTATPAGAAGLAAFLSGTSLSPAGAQPVPPPAHLAAKAVAASIILSAISAEPEKAAAKYSDFLARGFEVAQRIQLWERFSGQEGMAE
jgi:hypothetical protein